MQLTDKDGNIFGTGGLEITTSSGKPKVPVINTDITIGTTAIVGGVAGRLLFDDAGVVGETNGVHWDKVNGRLGLGTTTPTQTLDIQGDISIGLSAATTVRAYYNSTTRNQLIYTNTSSLEFFQSINERMRLAPGSGNLLLNTTTDAGYKLDVNGTARLNNNLILTNSSFTGTMSIRVTANNTITFGNSGIGDWLQAGSTNRVFILQELNSTARGNVLGNNIGTIAVNISTLSPQSSGTSNLTGLQLTYAINNTGTYSGIARGIFYNPTLTSLTGTIHRAIETVTGDVLFCTTSGNVGIGTVSPTNKLDISFIPNRLISFTQRPGYADYGRIVFSNVTGADIASSGNISLIPGDANEIISFGSFLTRSAFTASSNYGTYSPTGVGFQVHSNKPFVFRNISTDINTDFFVFEAPNTGARRLFNIIQNSVSYLTVFPTGNVTIGGTTDAGFKLDVNGTIRSNSVIYANQFFGSSGTASAPSLAFNTGWGLNFASNRITFVSGSNNRGYFDSAGNFLWNENGSGAINFTLRPSNGQTSNLFVIQQNPNQGSAVLASINGSGGAYFAGDTLIGTNTAAGYKLDVNGSARVQSGLTVSGSLNLNSSDISSAWTTYTPTWSTDGATQPSLGNGTITGAYKVIGKTVFVRVRLVFGTTTTAGTGTFYFSLPVNAAAAWGVQMPASLLDNGNAWYQATVNGEYGGFTDKVALITQSAGGANSSQGVTGVFPIGFGNTDSLQFNGSYESV